MDYPDDFKQKVKALYPDCEELCNRLEQGHIFVGQFLKDNAPLGIDLDTILAATSIEELWSKARILKEKTNIFMEWLELYKKQCCRN